MKRKVLLVLMGVMFSFASVNGQVSSYIFSQSSGTYTPITGGTVLGIATNDDTSFPNNPIGFTFWYNGVAYTSFSAQSNGFIAMGTAIASSYNALSTGTTNNVVSALSDDLQGEAVTGELRYETIGTAPNRTLVVQWSNYDLWASGTNLENYNFQIRLNETSNSIDVVYGSFAPTILNPFEVGLRGATNADFNNRVVTNGMNTWSTTTPGAFNTSVCEVAPGLIPASGETFTWNPPPPPAAPTTLTFTGVTTTGMTLNWIDNSTDELLFAVYRSLDGINYTFVGNVASTSTVTTGTPYNMPQTGLFSNTLYYWQVYAVASTPSLPLSGSQATLGGLLCGTYTVGPTGAYPSLTAAIADAVTNGLSCPCNFELQSTYLSTVETFPINIPFVGSGPGNPITVRPELGATNLSITTGASNTIVFNNATYFGFDGRPGGVGTSKELTIANTGTGFSAIAFTNDGENLGANYVKIQGVTTTTTNGVVNIGINATAAGKTNLYINNSAFSEGVTNPSQYIYSINGLANSWVNMTLFNNTFEDWFSATTATNAINIGAGNRGWNISNNKFYQTAPRTETTANTHNIILISTITASSGGNTIANNKFGGIDSTMAGNYVINGAVATRFNVINATGNTSFAANNITGNTIKNFNFSTTSNSSTSPGIWSGIVAAGTTNSFNITNNIIGSNTSSDSIQVTTTGTGGITYGITVTGSGANVITGNQIGGLKLNGTPGTVSTSCVGISVASTLNNTVSNNLIGSTTVNSNIRTNSSTSATAGRIDGIAVTSGTHVVSNNTVAGITNLYAGTAATGSLRGIFVSSGAGSINGNTITNLATLSPEINATTTPSVAGIVRSGAFNGITISNNIISNIYNVATPSAANVSVGGIVYSTTATVGIDNIISGNRISNLGAPFNTGSPTITGLDNLIGNIRAYNNFIDLGLDITASPITAPNGFIGISKSTTGSSRFLFNTVRIAGTGVNGGTTNTLAFRRTNVGATDTVKANIFTNFRSNGTSTGKHYSISLNNNTTITLDRNVYFGNGTGYVFGSYLAADVTNLSNWTATTSNDLNSFFANPGFISATDPHINGALVSIVESRAVGVTSINTDIDNDVRPGPLGSVNGGGTDPDIGADEVDAFPVTTDIGISLLVQPMTTGCHGASDSVIVRLKNYATTAAIDFSVDNVTINSSVGGPNPLVFPTIVLTSGTLAGNATMDIVVGTGYDMTALGTYTFNASATTPLDFINSNDAMSPVNITVAGGIGTASQGSICALANVTLTNTGATAGGTYQWEISQDALSWSNIPSATTNPYVYTDVSTGPDTLFFKSTSCGLHTSTVDTVIINYVTPAVGYDTSRCGPGLLDLNATGSGLLNWFDVPTGGVSLDTGMVYTPFLTQTDTFYVENSTGTANGNHTTTFLGGNNNAGNMFAITAINTITITGFDVNTSSTSNWSIYYRPDNYAFVPGANTTIGMWTLLGSATGVVGAGAGVPTPLPIPISITIPAGQTYSFHTIASATPTFYTNGTALDNIYNSNADLQFREGHGCGGPGNCINVPRIFNGIIHYTAGCSANYRDTVIATVTTPPSITATSSSGTGICSGTSYDNFSTFEVTSPDTNYVYTWSPASGLSSTTGDSITAIPTSATTYIVVANDSITGCANYDTLSLSVSMAPQFTTTVSEDTICDGAVPVTLTAVFGAPVDTIGFGTVVNTGTTYPAPYGNWYWGARHQFLITAADLTSFGVVAGDITGLAFDVVTPTGTPLTGFEIQMAPTLLNDLATSWETTGFTVVYPATNITPVAGWNMHTFTTPFAWDGVSNVIVQTCFNNTSFTNNDVVNQTATSYVSSRYFRADAAGVCPNPAVTGTASQRPNMVFYSTANYVNQWTPIATVQYPDSLTTDASPVVTTNYVFTSLDTLSGCYNYDTLLVTVLAPLDLNPFASPTLTCVGGNDTLVANASGGYGNYTYAWSDGLGTDDSALVSGIPFDYMIGVTVTDGCGTLTDSVLIDVVDPMNVTVTDTTNCGPGSGFVLNSIVTGGNGVYAYSWAPTSDTTSAITTGMVSSTTSYTLTVTDGCGTVDSDIATVTIFTPPTVNLGADVVQLNPPATLDAGPGFTSYLWSTSGVTQTINVSTNGTYWVMVTDANGCTDYDTIQVNFTAGLNNPDGSVATVSYYPNPTPGIVNVSIQGFLGEELKLEVTDLGGRVVRNYTYSEVTESFVQTMDLSTLRAGTYLLVLRSNKEMYTQRIVITTDY